MSNERDLYGDDQLESKNASIPGWLKLTYLLLPIWGIIWFMLFWNGTEGWLDRGHWKQLEEAAKTNLTEQDIKAIKDFKAPATAAKKNVSQSP